MPRRRELRGIAIDLGHSFNSRNNDHLGYWAIGQINLETDKLGVKVAHLNLLEKSAFPNAANLIGVSESMHQKLIQIVQSHALPHEWLKSADFNICFHREYEEKTHRYGSTAGAPYIFKLSLVSDLQDVYEVTGGGYCLPHNPERETRRTGY